MDDVSERYGRVASALHWLIGVLLLAEIAFGFLLDDIAPRGTPARAGVINLHKSTGMVLGVLVLVRLVWWLTHRPPAWPTSMPAWQGRAARLNHGVLYACMLLLPLSGYVGSNFSKYGVKFFGYTLAPWGPDSPAVYKALNTTHDVLGWVLSVLVALHVLAALKHALIDHDQLFARIWPWASARTSLRES
ncbi:MAG TPA: cytochrome b [Burkholderiaceae bacterium]|nr:cytochrome b [Burkholderiaceae bacterium]